MSQAKVDKYKNEKANRKKTNARNKVKRVIARIVAAAAVVALVGWGGYSGYQYYEKSRPVNCYYADISAVRGITCVYIARPNIRETPSQSVQSAIIYRDYLQTVSSRLYF